MKPTRQILPFIFAAVLILACNILSTDPTPTAASPAATVTRPATATPAVTPSPTPSTTPTPPPPPAEHPIQIRLAGGVAEFYDRRTGEPFIPRGANYFYIVPVSGGFEDRFFGVGIFDPARVAADFALLKEYGYNTVRIFLDSCSGGSGCAGNPSGPGLNPPYLDNIAETMRLAREAGLFLLLTSNDLPGQGGYWALVDTAVNDQFGPYRNAHYLTEPGVEAGRRYWEDLMAGLAERGAPFEVVLGWSLLNEQWYFYTDPPFSLGSGLVTTANGNTYDLSDSGQKRRMAVEGIVYYIQQLREVILRYDPTALITMGFFVPDYPNPIRQGDFRYVETAPLLEVAPLDFFDFHAYPGVDPFPPIAENFGMTGYEARPVILGEAGAFIDRYFSIEAAVRAMPGWIAESCQAGFDGFLYWGLYRAPEAIGDATWGLLDEDRAMLLALSAEGLPNPCDPALLPPENLALGRPVTASAWLPQEPPENAVDGLPAQWGAGGHPPQWIEVDLGRPVDVTLIRLVVGQWPAGETVHQLWGGGPGEELRLFHEFRGQTAEGDVLEFTPATPLPGLQFIRVVTLASPSWVAWKEIEVYSTGK
ncbi:MAG: discoidin domain-containing protein [Chloroflexi bacterium]|nr:discoidin domain-containing protein [Chloroflexota bacterium]